MSYSRGPTDDAMFYAPPQPPAGPQYRTQWPNPPEMPAGTTGQREAPGGTAAPVGSRRYRALMVGFFAVFLLYLIYLQTRADIGDNGTLRGLSDPFVAFGS